MSTRNVLCMCKFLFLNYFDTHVHIHIPTLTLSNILLRVLSARAAENANASTWPIQTYGEKLCDSYYYSAYWNVHTVVRLVNTHRQTHGMHCIFPTYVQHIPIFPQSLVLTTGRKLLSTWTMQKLLSKVVFFSFLFVRTSCFVFIFIFKVKSEKYTGRISK